MVALEIEFEDEILGGIQCLASLAEPVVAVVSCPLDNLEGYELIKQSDVKEFRVTLGQIHTWCKDISVKLS